jgi:hypothetical protein
MEPMVSPISARRGFLGRLGAGAVALMTGAPRLLEASPAVVQGDDKWVDGLKGKYRQYFDATSPNDGFPLAYAYNWMATMKSTYAATDKDLNAVVGFRHMGIPWAFTDAIWAKYKLGEFFKINDPKTKAPSVRNFFYHAQPGDIPFPDSAIDKLLAVGATFTVCNIALTVLSGMAGGTVKVAGDAAKKEWTAGLIPGMNVVASGVLAVHRAQQKGGCTYCYAG